MPKSLILTTIAVSALAFAVSANAETAKPAASSASSYFEVGASDAHIQGQNFGAVNFTIGKNLTKFAAGQSEGTFAVEAEGDIGVTNKTYNGVHLKVDYAIAGYAVTFLPIGTNTDLIARLGYMRGQVKGSAGGVSATDAESGPAFGFGLRYFPNGGNSGIRADMTHFSLSHNLKGDIYQVSYIRRF